MSETKIKHSIRYKMTIMFSAVLMAAFVICWLVNIFFLERYYVRNKQSVLTETYTQIDAASRQELLEEQEFNQNLATVCETNNISLLVMGRDGVL